MTDRNFRRAGAYRLGLCLVILALVAGCGGDASPPATSDAPSPVDEAVEFRPDLVAIQAAVDAEGRTDADRVDDAGRKPAEVLAFMGVRPDLDALDLFAGGGYYTEILSRAVGTNGSVLSHTNEAYQAFAGESFNVRFEGDRLPNVTRVVSEAMDLELEPESLDLVLLALVYHDIYYEPEEGGWAAIDGPALLAKLHDALRPGGIVALIDHSAVEGAEPKESVNALHRIDEAVVRDHFETAGFQLDAESELLRNPDDDRTVLVFDESIRRQSDRFVLRYKKPAS